MTTFETLISSESNEWYTPPEIIERARRALGGEIDLDPASNAIAQQWIKTKRFYTQEDDGMIQSWESNAVWLNPPYGQKRAGVYGASDLLAQCHWLYQSGDIGKAIVLARGDSRGIKLLQRNYPFVICDRISFLKENGSKGSQPVPGTFIFGLLPDITLFKEEFGDMGIIAKAL